MKFNRSGFYTIAILSALIAIQACKAKKLVQKPAAAPTDTAKTVAPVQETKPVTPIQETKPVATVQTLNFNFSNIQFEFNSSILRTDSYPVLDKAAMTMKMDTTAKFVLNGYASEEGTPEHNLALSQDRANSVKEYLINSGIHSASLTTTGYGVANPVADNSTEAGRVINRRVELHKQN
jgi:OOP family OmpA-OmpF porin